MPATVELFAPSGQSLLMRLCAFGSDSIALDDIALTEATNRKLLYTASVSDLVGWHTAHVRTVDGSWFLAGDVWMKSAGVCRVRDGGAAELVLTENDGAGDLRFTEKALEQGTDLTGIWSHPQRTITMPAAAILNALRGNRRIVLLRGATITIPLHGLGSIADREAIWFTVKENLDDDDDEAIVQIDLTGLLVIEAAAGTAAHGEITVNDEDTGSVDIVVHAEASQSLELRDEDVYWDLKIRRTGSTPEDRQVIAEGKGTVEGSATRAI